MEFQECIDRGEHYIDQGDYAQALDCYQKAKKINASDLKFFLGIGYIYTNQKRYSFCVHKGKHQSQ